MSVAVVVGPLPVWFYFGPECPDAAGAFALRGVAPSYRVAADIVMRYVSMLSADGVSTDGYMFDCGLAPDDGFDFRGVSR